MKNLTDKEKEIFKLVTGKDFDSLDETDELMYSLGYDTLLELVKEKLHDGSCEDTSGEIAMYMIDATADEIKSELFAKLGLPLNWFNSPIITNVDVADSFRNIFNDNDPGDNHI